MKQHRTIECRRGIALVMALVMMATLAVVLTVATKQIVSQRHMVHQRHRQHQAEWLARAGVELAAARLLESPAAFVEDKRELFPDASVHIEVEKAGEDLYTVTVEAELGPKEDGLMMRTGRGRFRRTDLNGAIRLQAVP